jgi:host factor-I protein
MADPRPATLQTIFLEHVRSKKVPVTVFLVNGIKLQGEITYFDTYAIALARAGHTQMIYKQTISTIQPGAPVQLHSEDEVSR